MLLALVVALLAAAPSAHAVDRSAAAKKALAALGTEKGDQPVIVFGLRRTLPAGTLVSQAGPSGAAKAPASTRFERRRQRRIRGAGVNVRNASSVIRAGNEPVWLFHEDAGPHQAFEHPGRIVLVGARTGAVKVSRGIRWVPLVGNRVLPFFRSASAYESKRYRVFSRAWPAPRAATRASTRQAAAGTPRQRIADALAAEKSCALRVSDTLGDFYDFGRVDQTRARLGLFLEGLERLNAGFVSRRYTTKAGVTPIQAAQSLIDEAGCRDLFIYVAGAAPRTGDAGIVVGTRPAGGGALEWHLLTGDQLEGLVAANRNVTFKFVFDAPHARMNEQLIDEPNTLLLLSSGGPGRPSFTFLPEVLGPNGVERNQDNPEQLLEFTNALLNGLEAFATSDTEVGQFVAEPTGSSMMAWMLARALGLSPAGTFVAPIELIKLPGVPPTPPVGEGRPSPINHTPVPTTAAQPTQEDTPRAITLTATDPDDDPLTFTVTDTPDHGTLSGTPPNLTYTPAKDFTGNDAFTYEVADNRGASASQTVLVPVTPDNDAAAVTTTSVGPLPAFVEDGAAVVVDGGLTLADPDSTQLEGATVTILSGLRTGDELLFTDQNGITGDYDAGVLTLTGLATLTQYRDALRSVEFDTTSQAPGLTRTIEFRAEDGDEAGVPATRTVTVEPTNDAPTISAPGAQSTNEDTGLSFAPLTSNAITVADVDAGSDAIEATLSVAEGTLALGDASGVAQSFGGGPGVNVTLTGTVSAINAALSGLQYDPAADYNGADALDVDVDDLGHDGTGPAGTDSESIGITVNAVNDAPENTVPGARTTDEDTELALTSVLSVADADANAIRTTLTVADGTLDVASTGGTLSGDGSDTVQIDGTVAQVNTALASVAYDPDANFAGGDTLNVVTTDLGNTGSGGPKLDTDSVAITVAAVNDAPQISAPGGQTVDEDVNEVFSTANASLISIADVDAGTSPVRVVLAAADGVLTLSTTSGLTFLDGTANGTGSLKLEGTVAAVNTALSGLIYRGDSNFEGTDSIGVDVSDLGNTGSGGAKTDSDAVPVTVSAVNDAPVNTVPGAQTIAEDTPLTLTSALSIADADAGAGVVRSTLAADDGTIDVAATGGSLTGDGTDTVQIEGTVAQVNAALATVAYTPATNFNGSDELTVLTTDLGNTGSGGAKTDEDTVAITVSAVNDAPVNALPATASMTEDFAFSFVTPNEAGVSDVDAGSSNLQVTLDVDHGTLKLNDLAGLDFSSGGDEQATMVFTGSAGAITGALNGMVYEPAANYHGPDTLTMTTSDLGNTGSGGTKTDTDTTAITVSSSNDAPRNTVPGAQGAVENTALTLGTISVEDVDTDPIEVSLDVDHGTLTLPTTAGLTFAAGGGDGTADAEMVFSGAQSALNAALDGVVYTPTNAYVGNDTLTVRSDDGPLDDTDTVAIGVQALNVAPVNSVPGAQSVDEDADLVFSTANSNLVSISDADAAGDVVRMSISAGIGNLTLGGTSGLTFIGGGNGTTAMTIEGTIAQLNTALAGLKYRAYLNYVGSDTITVTTNDLGNNGAGGQQTDTDQIGVTVSAVNDAPEHTIPSTASVAEGGTLTFSAANLNQVSLSDVDAAGGVLAMSLQVTNGTLTLPSTTGLTFGSGDGTADSFMQFTGTNAAMNTALNGMTFTPADDFDGTAQFDISSSDQGHTGFGGAKNDSDSLPITVTGVNDAPTIAVPPSPQAAVENIAQQLTVSVADVDADGNDVTVDLGVLHGTIDLATTSGLTSSTGNGTDDVSLTGSVAEVNAAMSSFTYTPAPNYFGQDSLSASVDDNGNTGTGGDLTDSDATTIEIEEANSAPVTSVPGTQTFDEDDNRTFSSGNGNAITISDPDALATDDLEMRLQSTHGVLDVTAPTGDLTSISGDDSNDLTVRGTASELAAALNGLVFDPDQDYAGSANINVIAADLGNRGAGGQKMDNDDIALTLSDVNDAPSLSAPADFDVDEGATETLTGAAAHQVTDVDATSVEVTMSVAHGDLTLDGVGGLTFAPSAGDGTADESMTFSGSVANVNAALDGMQYSANNNDGTSDTLNVSVDDKGSTGGGAETDRDAVAITINALNEAPSHTVPGTQTFDEDTTKAFSTGNSNAISVADADAAGATVRTTLTATQGTMSMSTTGVDFSCSSCAGNGTNNTTMTFEGTISAINAALQTLSYTPNQHYNGAAKITITTNDLGNTGGGGAQSKSDDVNLSITAINDGPQNTKPGLQSVNEDTNLVFSAGNGNPVSVADVDAGSSPVKVSLDVLHGTITLSGTAGLTFVAGKGNGTGSVHFTGTVADVNAALDSMAYKGVLNYFGTDETLTIVTNDQGNTGTGGSLSDTDTVAITVNPVNDAPVADDETFNGNQGAIGNTALVGNNPNDPAPVATRSSDPAPRQTRPAKTISGDILHEDTDVDSPASGFTVTPGSFQTFNPTTHVADGGSVEIEQDGDFIFQPPTGCTATGSYFDYTLEDNDPLGEQTDTGRVQIALAGCVWYVQNDSSGNSGTSNAPFDTLKQATDQANANGTIYVDAGDGGQTGHFGNATGFPLDSGERLIGEHEGLVVDPDGSGSLNSVTLLAAASGQRPKLTATTADVISLDDNNEVRGFEIDPDAAGGIAGGTGDSGGGKIDDVHIIDTDANAGSQPGLELDSTTGTFEISDLLVNNKATGVRVHNSAAPANAVSAVFDPSSQIAITSTGGPGLDVDGTSGTPVALGTSTFDEVTVPSSTTGGVRITNASGTVALGDGIGTEVNLTSSGATATMRLSGTADVTVNPAGTDSVVNTNGGPALDVNAMDNLAIDLETLSSNASASDGVRLDGTRGTVVAAAGSLANATNETVEVNGDDISDDVDFTYGGTISDNGGTAILISNQSGGTKDFNGLVTSTGGPVSVTSNTGGVTRFDAGLQLSTGTNAGLNASNGGTLAVTDPNTVGTAPDNTIATTTGTALSVQNTTIHDDDLTFRSVASNGAANGIVVNTTSNQNGRLVVAGTGGTCTSAGTCTGGAIQGSTGGGIVLTSVPGGASLTRMAVTGGGDDGIRATTVGTSNSATGLAIDTSFISGNGNAFDERGIDASEVRGYSSVASSTITGSAQENARFANTSGTLDLKVNGTTFSSNSTTQGGDGLQLYGDGSATMKSIVNNNTFTANRDDAIQVTTGGASDSTMHTTFNGNTVNAGGNSGSSENAAVVVSPAGTSDTFFHMNGGTIKGAKASALILNPLGTAQFDATVENITIGAAGEAQSGSVSGIGAWIKPVQNSDAEVIFRNSTIQQYAQNGMYLRHNDGTTGDADFTVTGNTIVSPNPGLRGIYLESGATATDTQDVCADIGGSGGLANSVSTSGGQGLEDIYVTKYANSTFRFPGLTNNTDAGIASYLASRNAGNGAPTAFYETAGGPAPVTGNNAQCQQPTLPQPALP